MGVLKVEDNFFSPSSIDFSVCDAVPSFAIDDFPNGKVFKDETSCCRTTVALSAGELNAQGFGRERTNNWNGKFYIQSDSELEFLTPVVPR